MTDTFHNETSNRIDIPLKAGDVIRVFDGAFGDAIILGFKHGYTVEAKVSRPYAYVSCVGTTGPTVLTGAETYTLTENNLRTILKNGPAIGTGRIAR